MDLGFFGLTSTKAPEIRLNLFRHIHEIIFYGKGGYDYETVYNMPLWLRTFTWTKINEHYEKEQENADKAQNKNSTNDVNRVKEILKKSQQNNPKSQPQNKQLKDFNKPPTFRKPPSNTSRLKLPKK